MSTELIEVLGSEAADTLAMELSEKLPNNEVLIYGPFENDTYLIEVVPLGSIE